MTLVEQILNLSASYAAARNLSRSRVSTIVFGDGKVIGRLANGSDLTTGRYQHAVDWFSENWPTNKPWPSDIPRPAKMEKVA